MARMKHHFPRIPPKPTWWQRQKKRLGYWWRRTRARIACWVLGIDRFEVKMKGTIRSWKSNIQGLCLTLDGNIDLMDGGTFTHNEGTVTMAALSTRPLKNFTVVTSGELVCGGTITCSHCGQSWKSWGEELHAADCPTLDRQ